MVPENAVWVFSGGKNLFPSAVFKDKEKIVAWIEKHKLTGTLTAYPLDIPVFDWALENGVLNLKKEKIEPAKNNPDFIANCTTASQEHFHYRNGKEGAAGYE